jgi:hypothetical protein
LPVLYLNLLYISIGNVVDWNIVFV